ncbi:hypothetical protein CQ054_23110 [Ochrobactrum sp. MYb29]|nr:hypothetical protein CQ054_23110 [Ochrobactrum sp. MYb29]TCQ71848.1 hypothetical protein EDF68_1246 [Ochrobactrum sp. BH3]
MAGEFQLSAQPCSGKMCLLTSGLKDPSAIGTTVKLIGVILRCYLRKLHSSILVSFIMETLAQDKFAKLCSIVTRKIHAVCTAPTAKKD